MNILVDSNVIIAAYPKPGEPPEALTSTANALLRLANKHGHTIYHHPLALQYDFGNIRNAADRAWRKQITSNLPAYLTVFPKHSRLISAMGKFGFTDDGEKKGTELVLAKCLIPETTTPDLLEYHIKYGPKYYGTNAPRFIVPIEPQYHNVLFPETGPQQQMPGFGTLTPAGNSIQKAYLSRGNIRQITPGAILYFYRSHDRRRIDIVGIAESTLVSKRQSEIASYVGKRTVYSMDEIRNLTENGKKEVLAILFRQARILQSGPTYEQLKGANVCLAAPQSIMQAATAAANWLKNHIDLTEQ